jgi:hypothetical protein
LIKQGNRYEVTITGIAAAVKELNAGVCQMSTDNPTPSTNTLSLQDHTDGDVDMHTIFGAARRHFSALKLKAEALKLDTGEIQRRFCGAK